MTIYLQTIRHRDAACDGGQFTVHSDERASECAHTYTHVNSIKQWNHFYFIRARWRDLMTVRYFILSFRRSFVRLLGGHPSSIFFCLFAHFHLNLICSTFSTSTHFEVRFDYERQRHISNVCATNRSCFWDAKRATCNQRHSHIVRLAFTSGFFFLCCVCMSQGTDRVSSER